MAVNVDGAFLASPLSDHVVGDNLVVDGGWLIGTPVELAPTPEVQLAA